MIDVRGAFAPLREPGVVESGKKDWFTEGKAPPWQVYATEAGVSVTPDSSLRLATAWSCVRLLSETIATLPLLIYRELPDGHERASQHPLYSLLHDQPNPNTPAVPFFEAAVMNLQLFGRAFGLVGTPLRPGALPDRIDLLMPWQVDVDRPNEMTVRFYYRPDSGGRHEIPADQLIYWRGLSYNGVDGLSPIEYARQTFGLARAAELFGQRFFGNNAHPGGVLSTEQKIDDDEREIVKTSIEAGYRGVNQLRLMVLDGGWKYTPMGFPPEQAQFLETRVKSDADVCKIFRVPPWMVGVQIEGTKPYANVEQEAIHFVTYSIRPWLVRLEQGLNLRLFPRDVSGRRDFFCEFLADALLRGDLKSRYEAYAISYNRWRTRNELRRLDNLSPVEGGDDWGEASQVDSSGKEMGA